MQNNKELKHKKRRIYLLSTILPMFLMSIVWAFMGVFPFGDKTLMAVDFGQQYIGLYSFLRDTVLSGDFSGLWYSFSKTLGGAMIGIWGFNLISPFNILYIILPLEQYPWAIFLTILLRYGATGFAMAFFLVRRYSGLKYDTLYVPLFAVSYALSGMIVSYQMNPIFYDAMIVLPIILVYLEEYLDGGPAYKYIAWLATAYFLHFYMAFMISVFLGLYVIFYYLWPKNKEDFVLGDYFRRFLGFFLSSLWAVAVAMVLLLPIVLNLILSKGAYENELTFEFALQINPLDILAKLMIGGFDNESGWSAGPNLPNIFVGSVALLGAILYFFNKKFTPLRKVGVGIILFVFFAGFVHMFTNKLWHMGQTPAGFFYRYSWITSFFMVFLAYKTFGTKVRIPWFLNIGLIVAMLGSAYYVFSNDYTFITKLQTEEFTKIINANQFMVYLIAAIIAFLASYIIATNKEDSHRFYKVGFIIVGIAASVYLLVNGYFMTQIILTLATWLLALLFFNTDRSKYLYTMALAMVSFELTGNAFLSQVTVAYDNAPKFSDASASVSKVVDNIQEQDKNDFYRIGSTFVYAKNDPFMYGYNGLSTFSSNLEKSTLDFFGHMGDFGGNAATYYANGTPWTDAMYSVKYFIDRKDYTNEDLNNNPNKKYFQRNSSRYDLTENYSKIYEDDRYIAYKNENVLPIAFGANYQIANVVMRDHYPYLNQNSILSALGGQDDYFVDVGIPVAEINNVTQNVVNGKLTYDTIEQGKKAEVTLKMTPATNDPHYFVAPTTLRQSMGGRIDIKRDNLWYYYTQSFDQYQLWNMAHNSQGKEVKLSFENHLGEPLELSGMAFYRADSAKIKKVIEDRKAQGMQVTSWSNTNIKGKVNITDDSKLMFTTIPHNPGWTVKVDGQKVETIKILNSMLAFPITSGEHEIELSFTPQGWYVGLGISSVALLGLISLIVIEKRRKK
ncbi:MAG: YfhO family protein [Gemella sp.]|nr:YfhO family protein [Gemella sp.]